MILPLANFFDWATQPFQALGGVISWLISFFSCFFLQLLRWVLVAMTSIGQMLFTILPSTPEQYKLPALLTAIASNIPFITAGELTEIFSGLSGIFAIFLLYKFIKMLPFI